MHLLALLTDMALCVNSATVGLQAGRQVADSSTGRMEVPLMVFCAFVRVSAFVLIYNGLLSIGVFLENPLDNDFISLPELAYQVRPPPPPRTLGSTPHH